MSPQEVLSEASSNARTNATNVTRVALGRAGIEADLDEAIEARLEGEEVGFQGPSEKQIADAMIALDKALLDPTEPESKVEQILTKFGASHPDYLEDLTDTIRGKAVHLETGSAIDVSYCTTTVACEFLCPGVDGLCRYTSIVLLCLHLFPGCRCEPIL